VGSIGSSSIGSKKIGAGSQPPGPTANCFLGFQGLLTAADGFNGLIIDNITAVQGLIFPNAAFQGTIQPIAAFTGLITDSEGFEGEICDEV